jgi:cytochrome P450
VGAHDLRVPLPAAVVAEVGPDYSFATRGHLNTMDPPEHTRVRKLMQKAFTPRRVNEREGMIRDLANGLQARVNSMMTQIAELKRSVEYWEKKAGQAA